MHQDLIDDFLDKCDSTDEGIVYHSEFSRFLWDLDYQPTSNRVENEGLIPIWRAIAKQTKKIEKDIDILDSLVYRINNTPSSYEDDLDPRLLSRYLTTDLESFHVVYRSLFDHIALVLVELSDNPDQFRVESFRSQREKTENEYYRDRIGENVFNLIRRCDWFDHIRSVRDSLVHHGRSFYHNNTDGFLLVDITHELMEMDILTNEIFDERSLRFQWYSALMMIYLHSYLEEIENFAFERLNLVRVGDNTGRNHPAINNYYNWINQLRND